MKIDNDFLTLIETIVLRIQRRDQIADNHDLPSTAITGRGPQLFGPLESDRLYLAYGRQIDALVAKINAADDACLSQIEKAMGRPAGDDRDAIIAMLRGELKQSRATIDAITADLKKREASMVEAKDAASICAAKLCDIAELLVDAANALIAVIPNEEEGE